MQTVYQFYTLTEGTIMNAKPETKHTPGPWHVTTGSREGANRCAWIYGGPTWFDGQGVRQTLVAECTPDTRHNAVGDFLQNAELLARAPDMLAENARLRAVNAELVAALAKILSEHDVLSHASQIPGLPPDRWPTSAKQARAALAKAREVAK